MCHRSLTIEVQWCSHLIFDEQKDLLNRYQNKSTSVFCVLEHFFLISVGISQPLLPERSISQTTGPFNLYAGKMHFAFKILLILIYLIRSHTNYAVFYAESIHQT